MKIFHLGLLIATCTLGACITHPKDYLLSRDFRPDGQALQPFEQVARLLVETNQTYPDMPVNNLWTLKIVSVNGVAIPNSAVYIQVSPGTHTLQYECRYRFTPNDVGGARSSRSDKFKFEPGQRVYGYVSGSVMTEDRRNGFVKTTGKCWMDRISTKSPLFL